MIAILIVIAGFALIFGVGDFAKKMLRTVAGLIIVLSFLPGLVEQLGTHASRSSTHHHAGSTTPYLLAAAVGVLALVGFVAWKTRAARAKRREAEQRFHGNPRERELPPPPLTEEDER